MSEARAPIGSRRIRDVESAVRRVRWVAIAFTVIQFSLFQPSADAGPIPFARVPWLIGFVVALAATNLLSTWAERRSDEVLRRVGALETAIDTALVVGGLWLFGFDPDVRLWPLLTFVVIEGALRAALAGALAVWAVGTVAYGIEQIVRGAERGIELGTTIPAITFASGILLFVAIGIGMSTRRASEADARTAVEKARLRRLAEVAAHLGEAREATMVSHRFVTASCELTGYEMGALLEYLDDDLWLRLAAHGIPDPAPDDTPRSLPAYTRLAHDLTGPTQVPVDGEMRALIQRVAPGVERLVATPVLREGRVVGLLFVATAKDEGQLESEQRALLGLLAGHAAVAIENARVAAARDATIADLKHLDGVKDDFLAILTHELRSPMTAMAGYADLLLDQWERVAPERREEFLGAIGRNTRRLAQLIEDVFDALRAERMELPVDLAAVDLEPIVREVAARHVDRSGAHTLDLSVSPTLRDAWADAVRAAQVIDNLVSNAVKYSPRGGPVRVTLSSDDDAVELIVSDDGLGIPERERERLFGKFARLHPGESIGGTGLGLYLVRQLVEAMGGSIDVESQEGVGSTFRVSLPVAAADVVARAQAGTDADSNVSAWASPPPAP